MKTRLCGYLYIQGIFLPLHMSNYSQVSHFSNSIFESVLKVVVKVFQILKFFDPSVERFVMPLEVEQRCYILLHQRASKDLDE